MLARYKPEGANKLIEVMSERCCGATLDVPPILKAGGNVTIIQGSKIEEQNSSAERSFRFLSGVKICERKWEEPRGNCRRDYFEEMIFGNCSDQKGYSVGVRDTK